MKIPDKLIVAIIIVFGVVNVLIFINRNKGFEYRKFPSYKELYPSNSISTFLEKWTKPNKQFTSKELNEGLILLNEKIGLDTISGEENKILRIADWLYSSFYKQLGTPDSSLLVKRPQLALYHYLSAHKEKQLWCGHFQAMFGFFCTAAGLPNRYIEIIPGENNIAHNSHQINEVYLAKMKKWVIVDVTRNRLLTKKNHELLSAAEYFHHKLKNHTDTLFFSQTSFDSVNGIFEMQEKNPSDKYFNEYHLLRYYHTMDLSKVYALWPKMRRYFLADAWYELYEPQRRHLNFLFRVKQFFLFGMAALIIALFFYRLRKQKVRNV